MSDVDAEATNLHPHTSHWGTYEAEVRDGEVVAVHPFKGDTNPSSLLDNIPGSTRHRARIAQPMVRAGWLDGGPGPSQRRGSEPFVAVDWAEITERLAQELQRVVGVHGAEAIYGGSYGWASAGRFHHAQSQVHRFLNGLGGYTSSVNTYSLGASAVILPRVVGAYGDVFQRATAWPIIAEHTDLMVCFGGITLKNLGVSPGGVSRHIGADYLHLAAQRGTEFVLFSPLRDDLSGPNVTWHPLRPGTDVAVMLALAYVLDSQGLHDTAFLERYCEGYDQFVRYLRGLDDGQPKTPEWAEQISGIPADSLRLLARRMAVQRTLITVSWSLQRIEHGEQAPWMGVVLAAMLGQIGLPGGGFGHGYGSMAEVGTGRLPFGLPTLPQNRNPISTFIPVARVSDMLLRPGEEFDYNGQRLTYPDIRLVYWCGGNPFHHHQDIGRLRRAIARPDTIVVHDPYWTPMARHADIVLPSTISLEREDIGGSRNDPCLVAMHQAIAPYEQARDDYSTFAAIADALGFGEKFTEGRTAREWLTHLYSQWQERVRTQHGLVIPPFEEFWHEGYLELPAPNDVVLLGDFRADPDAHPIATPSGRIEIFSSEIDAFGYDDCVGHPAWFEPSEWLGSERARKFPLHLIANQPRTRLHSQLDMGKVSQASKVQGREPVRLHPADAAHRGIVDGDVVKVFNDRGSCLAGAILSDDMSRGVVQLSTGAWYDPIDPSDVNSLCVHGNPNTLTPDIGTSRLAQGCSGQHALVQIEKFEGPLPPIR
ncbi:molybdopterin-dependent oxidoreductase, partial [Leekyejoonella antrihumi]